MTSDDDGTDPVATIRRLRDRLEGVDREHIDPDGAVQVFNALERLDDAVVNVRGHSLDRDPAFSRAGLDFEQSVLDSRGVKP